MAPSVPSEDHPADEIDFWRSYPINWPSLYAMAMLMLGT
jgi:hypothetical protein